MDLLRTINTCGKTDFVDWIEKCILNYNNKQIVIKSMINQRPDLKEQSVKTKINAIYLIIKNDKAQEGLDEVIKSTHATITNDIKEKAKNIKSKLKDNKKLQSKNNLGV